MEEILDTYKLPYNEEIPVVCMDEKPYQLLDQVLKPLPVKPGSIRKEDANTSGKGRAVSLSLHSRWQIIATPV